MGKTISVTLPDPLVDDLQKCANKVGVSRSRFIANLLLKWQDNTQIVDEVVQPINDCVQRDIYGNCEKYNSACPAITKAMAISCPDYAAKGDA